jgi:Fe-S-cluster containining protein
VSPGLDWFDRPDPTGTTDTGERGLRFRCTSCGNCCTGAPGYVHFTADEARAMARELGISIAAFFDRYTHETPTGRSLTEVAGAFGHDCVFLDRQSVPGKALCGVYGARPKQCRTWPFWPENLRSREAWARAARGCPGMNPGSLSSPETVRLTVNSMSVD